MKTLWFLNIICLSLLNLLPILIAVAFFTIAERKILGALQRRTGPAKVGYWGNLQAFADGFKLAIKEIVFPVKANFYLYLAAPFFALFLSLFVWAFIPLSQTSIFFDEYYNMLIVLAVSSLNVYTIIIGGWASNSKYSFLGWLRSSAQMIAYEISITLSLIPVFCASSSLNLTQIVSSQINTWYVVPFLPLAVIFLISMIAETNRAPFDLPEAEAELVAGFNLEYSSIVFAFYFLGEYSNMLLMSTIFSLLFLGGWWPLFGINTFWGLWLVLKVLLLVVFYIWIRGTLPRYRYDQLMYLGWKTFLPVALSFNILYFSFVFCFDIGKLSPYTFLFI